MATRDPRVDAYIANSAPFARPILRHLRATVHAACPAVEETIKWGMPHFVYHGNLCHIASFQRHCAFGIWKGARIVGAKAAKPGEAMGQFGRVSRLADLPSKRVIVGYLKMAMKRNASGVKDPGATKRAAAKKPPRTSGDRAAPPKRNRRRGKQA